MRALLPIFFIVASSCALAQDLSFMQKVADNWDATCRNDLHIETGTLPWIIFYDSTTAWHINPEAALLPVSKKLTPTIRFAGQQYPIVEVTHNGMLWIPGHEPIDSKSFIVTTMPFGSNQKTFFIAPTRSYFYTLAPADTAVLNQLFTGMINHELTHTRQLPHVVPQLIHAQEKYKLPESLHDNSLEETFTKNEEYRKIFSEEKTHLWNAVVATNGDSVRKELKAALDIADKRKKKFFTGQHEGYKHVEDIFLALEGSAMWAQYRLSLKHLLPGQSPPQLLFSIVQHGNSWVQEEGLALFLIIDKLVPAWQSQFFSKELPSPFVLLKKYASK